MSLLFRVIFSSACTSTHHKLALDALCHLRGRQAKKWQNLFLKHYKVYLKGSKAPDKDFKDFRNHVLHVRDNYWGGAPKTARKWYDRTVQSLAQRDWPDAIYSAGVLSHYYTDPIQPFHTGQSQRESDIHLAAEWSIAKAYDEIKKIQVHVDVKVPSGEDWLEQMVAVGAEMANPHYDTLIEHYDLRRGVRNPPSGLDNVSREILATLIAHAAVGFARILDRAFDESEVSAPLTEISLQGFLSALQIPVFWVTRRMSDAQERKTVRAMYDELLQTGEVVHTLPEDDRTIRELHAIEVNNRAETNPPARHQTRKYVTTKPGGKAELPVTKRRDSKDAPKSLRFYLDTTSDVEDAPSIGPKTARRLEKIGVKTVTQLFELDPKGASARLGVRYITADVIRDWKNQARLVCRIPRLRGHDAQILVACGWREPDEIAGADPQQLFAQVSAFVKTMEGQRIIRSGKPPDLAEVTDWIQWSGQARTLQAA